MKKYLLKIIFTILFIIWFLIVMFPAIVMWSVEVAFFNGLKAKLSEEYMPSLYSSIGEDSIVAKCWVTMLSTPFEWLEEKITNRR